jgi:hypothetical protein
LPVAARPLGFEHVVTKLSLALGMGCSRWAAAALLALAAVSAAELRGSGSGGGNVAAATTADCGTPTGLAAARAAVASWTRRHRHAKVRHLYHTWTRARLLSLHPCVADRSGSTRERDVVVVVMASSKKRDRLARQQASWGRRAEEAGARVVYVSDAPDAQLRGVTVLDDPASRDGTYDGAQHRSLRGLQHAVEAHPDARWYWLVDDDTYYDVSEAAAAVRFLDHRVPAAVGYVYRGMLRFGSEHRSSIFGGAGILLSAGAAAAMAPALYTAACPFTGVADITLSQCAYNLDVPLVRRAVGRACAGRERGGRARGGLGAARMDAHRGRALVSTGIDPTSPLSASR